MLHDLPPDNLPPARIRKSIMSRTSVLILTLNEEVNLAECLRSCAWCDDVVVLDSFSTDRTVSIASEHGARVVQRAFDNYAGQRNAGLHDTHYRHPWVLMVDADERVPAELADEIERVLTHDGENCSLYRMRRKDLFFGRWLRHSSGYPTWFGRLVRPSDVRVERAINEEYLTAGRIAHLNEHLEHHPLNKGIAWWFERHNRYSTLEAAATLTERTQPINWRTLFASDPIARRRSLKRIAYRIPARPLFVFGYLYVIRGGFLDGLAGLSFSAMRACYEFMIDLKVMELRVRKARSESTAPAGQSNTALDTTKAHPDPL
jgi:glycosyltransferase involved in cell wall biosynthesis